MTLTPRMALLTIGVLCWISLYYSFFANNSRLAKSRIATEATTTRKTPGEGGQVFLALLAEVTASEFASDVTATSDRNNKSTTSASASAPAPAIASVAVRDASKIIDPILLEKQIQYALEVADKVKVQSPWFADLDLSSGFSQECGWNKCFYLSRSNPKQGYLVTQQRFFQGLLEAQNLERQLHDDYGIPRLMLSTEEVSITKEMRQVLRSYTHQWDVAKQRQPFRKVVDTITMQRVHRAPEPHFLVAFPSPDKGARMMKRIPRFREQLVSNLTAFAERYRQGQDQISHIVRHYPALMPDFQILVDPTGQVFHMDLDRGIGRQRQWNATETESWAQRLEQFLTFLLQELTPTRPLDSNEIRQECPKFLRKHRIS